MIHLIPKIAELMNLARVTEFDVHALTGWSVLHRARGLDANAARCAPLSCSWTGTGGGAFFGGGDSCGDVGFGGGADLLATASDL